MRRRITGSATGCIACCSLIFGRMAPPKGETQEERAIKFQHKSDVLKNKARHTRVAQLMRARPDLLCRIEEKLVEWGEMKITATGQVYAALATGPQHGSPGSARAASPGIAPATPVRTSGAGAGTPRSPGGSCKKASPGRVLFHSNR